MERIHVIRGINIHGEQELAIELDLVEIHGIYLLIDQEHNNNIMKKCVVCKDKLEDTGILAVGNNRILLFTKCDECLSINIAQLPDQYPLMDHHKILKEMTFTHITKGDSLN